MMFRILFLLLAFPTHAFALEWNSQWDKFRDPIAGSAATGSGTNFLIDLAEGWYTLIFNLIMGICIIAVIWGASMMQGVATDEGNREKGKKIIIGALIGLVLALLARSIVNFADNFLDATNFPACPAGTSGPGCP